MGNLQEGLKFFMRTSKKEGEISSLNVETSKSEAFVPGSGQRIDVRLTSQGVEQLKKAVEELPAPGVKLSIHFGKKKKDGREFTSGFMFANSCTPMTEEKKKYVAVETETAAEEMKNLG